MEPIISPWYFYLINVSSALDFTASIVGTLGILFGILLYIGSKEDDNPEELKLARCIITIGIIGVFLSILIPSEDTLYKMLAASLVTPDNITIAEDGTIDFIERLAEAIAKHIK